VINSYAWDFNNDGTTDSTDQNPSYTYTASGTYSVKLTVTGPDYSDEEIKSNIISTGTATITVNVAPESIAFGTMAAGTDETGSTAVAVTTDGGTAWSVTGAASNGGYMGTGSANLANPFQLANGGGSFQAMTSDFSGFMTGTANEDRTDTANVKQAIGGTDQPGIYSIQLTFTGGFI
jgi:PKD repeat protein